MADIKNVELPNTKSDVDMRWHSLALDDVLVRLDAPAQGLSAKEAAKRLEKYGPNELKEKPRPTFLKLVLAQFNNFIVILLIGASLISAMLGDWLEAVVI